MKFNLGDKLIEHQILVCLSEHGLSNGKYIQTCARGILRQGSVFRANIKSNELTSLIVMHQFFISDHQSAINNLSHAKVGIQSSGL